MSGFRSIDNTPPNSVCRTPTPELLCSGNQLDRLSPTLPHGMYGSSTLDDPSRAPNDKHPRQFFLATIVGQIFDTYGPRMLIVVGAILISLSLILTSVLSEYYELMIAHGVIFGIGSAMLYSPSVSGKSTYPTGIL